MAANSEESLEERMGDELLGTKGPVAPRSLTMEDASEDENENSGDILDEQEDEERNRLLELKKSKDWLQQQKINHEAELLVRKLLILTRELLVVIHRESCSSETSVTLVKVSFIKDETFSMHGDQKFLSSFGSRACLERRGEDFVVHTRSILCSNCFLS